MKKRIILLILSLVAIACVGLVGCNKHEHTFSTAWEHNATHHWHPTTCGHDDEIPVEQMKGYEAHNPDTNTGLCKCGYNIETGETIKEINGVRYRLLPDGTYELSKLLRVDLEDLTIPEDIDGIKVTSIGTNAFVEDNFTRLKNIVMSDSITNVSDSAFAFCDLLKSVKFSSDLKTIGRYAFRGCTSLLSVELPSDLKTVGQYAFEGCTALSSAELSDSLKVIPYGMFSGCTSLDTVKFGAETTVIEGYAFDGCESLKEATLPSKVENIGDMAFFNNDLVAVTIPAATKRIGTSAFEGCASLETLVLGNGLTEIGSRAFAGCEKISGDITVPDGVDKIENEVFYECSTLTNVKLGSGITSIGDNAFYSCEKLSKIELPDNVESIGDNAFFHCLDMNEVKFGKNLKKIGSGAFMECSSIEEIDLGNTIAEIGEWAFLGCSSIGEVTLPDSLEYIGTGILGGCTNVRSLTVPFIGNTRISNSCVGYFFDTMPDNNTTALKKNATLPNVLKTIKITSATMLGENAFLKCDNLEKVLLPDTLLNVGSNAFSNSALLEFKDEEGLRYLGSETNPHLVVVKAISKDIASCEIDQNAKIIMDSAFEGCASLASIVIPEGVVSVGYKAFTGCDMLSKTTDDQGLTYLGDGENPYRILLSGNGSRSEQISVNPDTEIIAGGAFYVHSKLVSVEIPDGVKSIGNNAFYDCNKLKSISLPQSVTILGSSIFGSCGDLTDVTIPGNIESAFSNIFADSSKIERASVNALLLSALTVERLQEVNVVSGEKIDDGALENCSALRSVNIGDSVKYIGNGAFQNCIALSHVEFSDELISIGDYAFYSCGKILGKLILPDKLVSVGENAFYFDSFTSIKIGKSLKYVGSGAFGYLDLKQIEMDAQNENFTLTGNCLIEKSTKTLVLGTNDVIIPTDGSVTSIGDFAFYNRSNMTSITIPTTVTQIGRGALANVRPLNTIVYLGTTAQWNEIVKGIEWNFSSGDETTNEILVVCIDGNLVEVGI